MTLNKTYDIVVLGGGPAGLAAVISILQKKPLSILIVEGQDQGHERIGESCPPDTLLLLKQLGVSMAFKDGGHATCPGHASIWGRDVVGYNDSIVNPMGPSWRLNRRSFDGMLADKAIELGAQIAWSTRFTNSKKNTGEYGGYTLDFMSSIDKSTQQIAARYVIDATGSTARFAKTLGIEKTLDDQLFATVRFASIIDGKMSKQVQIEATSNGWWYNALLPDQRIVTMIVTEKENLPALQEDDFGGFASALAKTIFIGPVLDKLTTNDAHHYTWPINSGILQTIEGEDWMAIGDAASSYDPIAAQGVYKALTDGILSSDVVVDFFNGDSSRRGVFRENVRKRYEVYIKNRSHMYRMEQRWPTASFWRNRWVKSFEREERLAVEHSA